MTYLADLTLNFGVSDDTQCGRHNFPLALGKELSEDFGGCDLLVTTFLGRRCMGLGIVVIDQGEQEPSSSISRILRVMIELSDGASDRNASTGLPVQRLASRPFYPSWYRRATKSSSPSQPEDPYQHLHPKPTS